MIECSNRRSHPRFFSGWHVADNPSELPVEFPRDGLSAA
jgi:hypothetical protein